MISGIPRSAIMAFLLVTAGMGGVAVYDMSTPCSGSLGGPCVATGGDIVATDVFYADEYQIPRNVEVDQFKLANTTIPVGTNATVLVNFTNTGNETEVFTTRIEVWESHDAFLLFTEEVQLNISPGETVHRELEIGPFEEHGSADFVLGSIHQHVAYATVIEPGNETVTHHEETSTECR